MAGRTLGADQNRTVTAMEQRSRDGESRLSLVGGRPLHETTALRDVLRVLTADERFRPEEMRLDEGRFHAFDLDQALRFATGQPVAHELQVRRNTDLPYEAVLLLGRRPGMEIRLSRDPDSDAQPLFAIADQIVRVDPPEIAWVIAPMVTTARSDPTLLETLTLIDASITGPGVAYDDVGPGGLTHRTYIGPRLVTAIGEGRVRSTPVSVEEMPGGVVRLDLDSSPWAANANDLADVWRKAMAHLAPAGIFADTEIDEHGEVVRDPGPDFTPA
jgi:hypothetical protein